VQAFIIVTRRCKEIDSDAAVKFNPYVEIAELP
jgi:hypothetical protein